MKKKIFKVLVPLAVLIAVLFPLSAGSSAMRLQPKDFKGIDKIKIESQKTDMNERTSVTIKTGSAESISGNIADWSVSNGKLKIRPAGDIVITLLPGSSLEELDIEILSGNIRIDSIDSVGEIETVCTTGTTTIRNTFAENGIQATSTHGRIIFENASAPEINLNSVIGSIRFRGEAEKLEASTLLGTMDIDAGKTREIKLNTARGDMTVKTGNRRPAIDFDTMFGRYDGPESVKEDADMKIKAHSLDSTLKVELI